MSQRVRFAILVFVTLFTTSSASAQTDLEKAQNLATCLEGRYPALCKRQWLTSEELRKVEVAEHREMLKTCLTGRYPALCNKANLSADELQRVISAEKLENLKTCLLGRYPALCNKALLTGEQLAEMQKAEAAAAQQLKQYSSRAAAPRRRHYASSSDCESGHWIESVSDDGEIVKLEDDSVWEVDAGDTVDSALWLPTTDIVVCDDKLINTEDNESVSASRLR
ncbi:MAG: hypothetical protein ACYCZD_03955 [Rhodanobacter sp.]